MKASHKQLKILLVLRVQKLGPVFVALKLGEFLLFDSFFNFSLFDLDNFWDLADFWLFDLPVFGFTCFDPSLPLKLLTLLVVSSFAPSFSLMASICDDMIVFSTKVISAAILLKPLINQ